MYTCKEEITVRCWKILAALKRSRCFPHNGSQIYGALLSAVVTLPLLHLEILYSREKIEFIINPLLRGIAMVLEKLVCEHNGRVLCLNCFLVKRAHHQLRAHVINNRARVQLEYF